MRWSRVPSDSLLASIIRTVAVLGFGRIFARILMVLAVPILARFCDAEAFGLFGVYNSASGVLSVAAALCYDEGIVPARSEDQAAVLLHLSLLIAVVLSIFLQLVMWLGYPFVQDFDSSRVVGPLVFLLPVATLANAFVLILLQWANRTHRDRLMSSSSILRAGCMVAAQVAAAWLASGGVGLIVGQLVGSVICSLFLATSIRWPSLPFGRRRILMLHTARQLSSFPLYSFPRAILEAAAAIGKMGLLTALFGPANVGLYWMAQRIVSIPSQIIDEPMRQVFYRAASGSLRRGDGVITPLIMTMAVRAAVIVPFLALIFLFGDGLFIHILGPTWEEAAIYAKLMSLSWAVGDITVPLHALPVLLGRQKFQLVAEVVGQATAMAAILLSYVYGGFAWCVGLLSIHSVLFAIGFGVALFLPKATRILAVGSRIGRHGKQHLVDDATT